jgi:predicted transcriptional regulator
MTARKPAAPAKKSVAAKKAAAPVTDARPKEPAVSRDEIRELTDAVTIRALAHPVRMALLEALTREGPLTATQAAEIVDESPANCSFHFRTLQKYGYVEELPGSKGRARPWRRATLGQRVNTADENSEASVAAQGLAELSQGRSFDKLRRYIATSSTFPRKWRQASFSMDWLLYVTPEELGQMEAEIFAVISRHRDRTADIAKRPEGSQAVQVAAYGFPLPPSASGN